MSDRQYSVDTSGTGGNASRNGWFTAGWFTGSEAQGGHGDGGDIKIGSRHSVADKTFKATGTGGSASNNRGAARGGNGKGGSFTLE